MASIDNEECVNVSREEFGNDIELAAGEGELEAERAAWPSGPVGPEAGEAEDQGSRWTRQCPL